MFPPPAERKFGLSNVLSPSVLIEAFTNLAGAMSSVLYLGQYSALRSSKTSSFRGMVTGQATGMP